MFLILRRWSYRHQRSHRSSLSKGTHTALYHPSNPQQYTLCELQALEGIHAKGGVRQLGVENIMGGNPI